MLRMHRHDVVDGSRLMNEYLVLHPAPALPGPACQAASAAAAAGGAADRADSAAQSAGGRGQMGHVDKAVRRNESACATEELATADAVAGSDARETGDSAVDPTERDEEQAVTREAVTITSIPSDGSTPLI